MSWFIKCGRHLSTIYQITGDRQYWQHKMLSMKLLKFVLLNIFLLLSTSKVIEAVGRRKPAVPAIFVFGDSTVDPGNNNFIGTPFTSDFPPYGQDLPNHQPTGRFSNGRLVTDFMAEYAGLTDLVPPYLDPNLSFEDMITGVSFASAGSGFDPLTPKISGALSMKEQLDNFKEFKCKLIQKMGKEKAEEVISKSLYAISAGTNDFVVNYITIKVRELRYSVTEFEKLIVQYVLNFTQGLVEEGAKKFSIGGLAPIGCLPMVITLYSKSKLLNRGCIDSYSAISRSFNRLLATELAKLGTELAVHGVKIAYADVYNPVMALIQQRDKFGIENVNRGCCGSGYLEVTVACNSLSWVCSDASKYVFFDSIHPTEKTYYYVFQTIRPNLDYLFKD